MSADRARGEVASIFSWCLYDWAMSAYNTVILTFVFNLYFIKQIAPNEDEGKILWAWGLAAAAVIIAIGSPVLGAIADRAGRLKRWILAFTALSVAATALLWLAEPEPGWIVPTLLLVGLSYVTFEYAIVFYNALLPVVAPPAMMGRVSGWAWGLGYVGGLGALALCLLGLIGFAGVGPFLPFPADDPVPGLRATALAVALWYGVFALPLFLYARDVPDTGIGIRQAVGAGLRQLWLTARQLPRYGQILWFLAASTLYRDGVNTIFALGGAYAGTTMGMNTGQVIVFAIGLNVTAAIGAVGFAFLDDRLGSRTVIYLSLAGLVLSGVPLILTDDIATFIGLALVLGIFVGPIQAASRTLMARLAPPGLKAEMFGLYQLTGKATAPLGPLLYATLFALTGNERLALSIVIWLFLAGGLVLWFVREPAHDCAAAEEPEPAMAITPDPP